MSHAIADITPLNFLAEKEKCLQDSTYNPQFEYRSPVDHSVLTQWGLPQEKYLKLAQRIVSQKNAASLPTYSPGSQVDRPFIESYIQEYLLRKKITGFEVLFTTQQIARCMVSGEHISFKLPLHITEEEFMGLFRHEVETHILRRWNHTQNFEHNYIDHDSRRTEEGMAGLHTYLFRPYPLFYRSSLRYMAISLSLTQSFVQVRQYVEQQGETPEAAILIAMRAKRGYSDLSEPGAITRDIVYLEGAVKVSNWLAKNNHDPRQLYIGRLTTDEAEAYNWSDYPSLVIPEFMDDKERYLQEVRRIAAINGFDQIS